jgi:hypothetical protein
VTAAGMAQKICIRSEKFLATEFRIARTFVARTELRQ